MTLFTDSTPAAPAGERAELAGALQRHHGFLVHTVQGLGDDQARLTPTASELCLGGLVKHVAAMLGPWLDFTEGGPDAMYSGADSTAYDIDWDNPDDPAYATFADGFRLLPTETLAGVLADLETVVRRAVEVAATADLDRSHPLPEAPWFEPGAVWSTRRVLLHLLAEIAQHAGHADILRESIDGQKTMG